MESVIAGLLKEFEEGKTSRRQLIRNLALAAVAVPTAALAGTPPAALPRPPTPVTTGGTAPWKTVYLDHISYSVADYKRSADFYADLMGWEVRNDNGTNQASLNINGIGGIIIRNGRQRPDAEPAEATARGRSGRPRPTGVINHISWGIEPWDTEGVKAELERRGLNPRDDMVGENFKSYHVRDPDGWDLQISNKTKPSED
jgi:catechol 2,3-dioxygenase-like lactoylglutathione lyase family enzyme